MSLIFKGTHSGGFAGYELTSLLEWNLKHWLNWALLHQGAFGTVRFDSANAVNPTEARLAPVHDERYFSGQVWNGFGREWVWESGVDWAERPFRVSGVYVDGTFHPQGTSGMFAHHIDYQHGRIIFDQPQGSGADIRAEYCYRNVHVTSADHPDFRALMLEAAQLFSSGDEPADTPTREHQIWLPSIFIEVSSGRQRGLQLGGGQIKTRQVVLHVLADNKADRDLLADWLDYQTRSAFVMADLNAMSPVFDEHGQITAGVTNWLDLVAAHPWRKLRVMDGTVSRLSSLNPRVFRARATWQTEIDMPTI
jgi:hypothetical protein